MRGFRVYLLLIVPMLALLARCPQSRAADGLIVGADVSDCTYFQGLGAKYIDRGQPADIFSILKTHHINLIRLRLFTSTNQQARQAPYDSINNMLYTLPLAVHAAESGMPWMLDFHYSDLWADANHQLKPAAWRGLTFFQLEQRMYDYNRDCIRAFREAGAMPRYVQIGNEITSGLVWPDAETDTPGHWKRLGRLLNAAIRGIRDGAGPQKPKIVIHIGSGDQWDVIRAFFDRLRDQQVDFDVIGLSYFPDATSKLEDLQSAMAGATARYARPVMIAETAFPWSQNSADADAGEPILGLIPGAHGQAQYAAMLCQAMTSVPGQMGVGIVWWGAEYENIGRLDLNGYDCSSLFDGSGNVLPVIDVLGRFAIKGNSLAGGAVTQSLQASSKQLAQ